MNHQVVELAGRNSRKQVVERIMQVQRSILRWAASQAGQDLAEYSLILAFVVLALVAELRFFGMDLQALYGKIIGGLPFAF